MTLHELAEGLGVADVVDAMMMTYPHRAHIIDLVSPDPSRGRCQSKILNTCSGHRTAQIDLEKCRKINGREIRF